MCFYQRNKCTDIELGL